MLPDARDGVVPLVLTSARAGHGKLKGVVPSTRLTVPS